MRRLTRALAAVALAAGLSLGCATPALAYTEYDVLTMQGHGTISPGYLVVHSTANPGATAANHRDYWNRIGNNNSMAHWVIDWTGTCYQMAASDRLVWHVGNGNRYSVGIEICEATNLDDFRAGWDEAARWCADFLRSRGWGVDRMVSHDEARSMWGGTDHTDPTGYFARYGRSWSNFEGTVQWYLDHGTGSGAQAPTTGVPSGGGSSQGSGSSSGASVGSSLPGGAYRVNCDVLNIRAGHSTSSADVGNYYRGQTVNLDDTYYVQDGYVWGTYVAYSGNRRYVAVGRATGSVEPDDYLLLAGGSGSSGGSSSSGSIRVGSTVRVTSPYDEHGTHLAVSGTYTVMEVSGGRVVIGRGGVVTAALPAGRLALA